jgi:methionine-rich copper-binding protein CopC
MFDQYDHMEDKNMKAKVWIMVGVLIIALAAMVAPVMAASPTADTVVSGNPASYVDITVSSATISMTLTPSITNHYTTATLGATANGPTTIKATDAGTNSKPSAGYMVNCTTSGNTWSTDKLGSKMTISGTNVGVFTASTVADLGDLTPETLYTGSGEADTQSLALSFNQAVTVADPILPSGYTYKLPVTFTIAAS